MTHHFTAAAAARQRSSVSKRMCHFVAIDSRLRLVHEMTIRTNCQNSCQPLRLDDTSKKMQMPEHDVSSWPSAKPNLVFIRYTVQPSDGEGAPRDQSLAERSEELERRHTFTATERIVRCSITSRKLNRLFARSCKHGVSFARAKRTFYRVRRHRDCSLTSPRHGATLRNQVADVELASVRVCVPLGN